MLESFFWHHRCEGEKGKNPHLVYNSHIIPLKMMRKLWKKLLLSKQLLLVITCISEGKCTENFSRCKVSGQSKRQIYCWVAEINSTCEIQF